MYWNLKFCGYRVKQTLETNQIRIKLKFHKIPFGYVKRTADIIFDNSYAKQI